MSDSDQDPPPPRKNPHLHGHEEAEQAFLEAFNSGRMAHAWLICGPHGVGKATLAYRVARFVLAGGGGAGTLYVEPDHPVFRRVASGGHADLLTVERGFDEKKSKPRSEIIVDDVRGIGAFLSLTPAEGGWRVVVVDCADDMKRSAANAALKVLEEPSPRVLILLTCHNPGRLLATIRSRCRRLTLKPLADERLAALLAAQCPGLGGADGETLARLAEGSMGRALTLVREDGLDLHRDLLALLQGLPALDVVAVHAFGDRLARADAEQAFRVAADLLRGWLGRLVVFAAGGGKTAFPGDAALMQRLVASAGLDRWLEVWEKINRLLARVDSANLDRRQVLLNAFLAMQEASR